MNDYRGKTIDEGLSKADWYSICSRHPMVDVECFHCMTGQYVNRRVQRFDAFFCRFAYPLWYWWKNRPNSRSRRFLEATFPKLRGDREA